MSAREFLKRLEQTRMVSEPLLAELKKRVAQAPRPIRTEILAKLLVDRGELTAAQARKLVRDAEAAAAAAKEEQELELMPLDDEPDARSWSLTGAAAKPPTPADEGTLDLVDDEELGLANGDDEVELAELDEDELPPPLGASPHEPLIEEQAAHDLSDLLADPLVSGGSGGTAPARRRGFWESLFRSSGKQVRAKRWDSPLLLFGGGGLLILLFAGFMLLLTIFRESGDELYGAANSAYESRSYNQAIEGYDKFLHRFSKHPKAPLARVRRELSRLRQVVENSTDGAQSLEIAQTILPIIELEGDAFAESRPELAGLLPAIAEGLTNEALRSDDVARKQALVDLARQALALVNNSNYLPTSVRRAQETRIEEIQENIFVTERDIGRDTELASSVQKMQLAAAQGRIAEAYRVRSQLLAKYPPLRERKELVEAVKEVTRQEQAAVAAVSHTIAPASEDRAVAFPYRVALGDRRGTSVDALQGQMRAFLINGAVYGVHLGDGSLLWRRFVGFESTIFPQRIDADNPRSDWLLVDARHQELLRVSGDAGKLVWRMSFPTPLATPTLSGDVIYVTAAQAEPGYVWAVAASTGKLLRGVSLPAGSLAGALRLAERNELFVPGYYASLYVLDAESLACKQVIHLGHEAGSIVAPPAALGGNVLVGHNLGADFSQLELLRFAGTEWQAAEPLRLDGHVVLPMQVAERRLMAVTDRGAVVILAADPTNPQADARPIASLLPKRANSMLTFPLMHEGDLWVADRALTKLQLQTTRGELRQQWVRFNDDYFLGPLDQVRDYVIHVRRRHQMRGGTVSAVPVNSANGSGDPVWQLDLGVPLVDGLIVRPSEDAAAYGLTANGALFAIDAEALRRGVNNASAARIDERLLLQALDYHVGGPGSSSATLFAAEAPAAQGLLARLDGEPKLASIGWQLNKDRPTGRVARSESLLLVPCDSGLIYGLDPARGRHALAPFQPRLEPNVTYEWLQPGLLQPPEQNQFLAALKTGTIYCVGRQERPSPFLAQLRKWNLPHELVAGVATLGRHGFVVMKKERNAHVVRVLDADSDEPGAEVALEGRVEWGPLTVGESVLVGDDAGNLLCFHEDGSLAWQLKSQAGPLAGTPLLDKGRWFFLSQPGSVWSVDAAGQPGDRLDVGEPLAGQMAPFRGRLLVPGQDGTVYFVDRPGSNGR